MMPQLADYLGELMDRSVIDHAAFDGKFNMTTPARSDEVRHQVWIVRAPEQPGLKLSLTKAPAECLVIDSVERPSAGGAHQ